MASAIAALVLASAATAATSPHALARAELTRCKHALAPLHLGPLTKQSEAAQTTTFKTAVTACAVSKTLKADQAIDTADQALSQAVDAQVGVTDALANYRKYRADIAAGKTGHAKILNYALAELTQAKILLDEALTELK